MTDPHVTLATFEAHIRRLDQADQYNNLRLEAHILDYRREAAEVKSSMVQMDSKLNQLLDNQARIRGRDGVIFVLIGALVSILTTIIAASILGVLG